MKALALIALSLSLEAGFLFTVAPPAAARSADAVARRVELVRTPVPAAPTRG